MGPTYLGAWHTGRVGLEMREKFDKWSGNDVEAIVRVDGDEAVLVELGRVDSHVRARVA